jgi:hypothetical protein
MPIGLGLIVDASMRTHGHQAGQFAIVRGGDDDLGAQHPRDLHTED